MDNLKKLIQDEDVISSDYDWKNININNCLIFIKI